MNRSTKLDPELATSEPQKTVKDASRDISKPATQDKPKIIKGHHDDLVRIIKKIMVTFQNPTLNMVLKNPLRSSK